jgi:hypothetical protein
MDGKGNYGMVDVTDHVPLFPSFCLAVLTSSLVSRRQKKVSMRMTRASSAVPRPRVGGERENAMHGPSRRLPPAARHQAPAPALSNRIARCRPSALPCRRSNLLGRVAGEMTPLNPANAGTVPRRRSVCGKR